MANDLGSVDDLAVDDDERSKVGPSQRMATLRRGRGPRQKAPDKPGHGVHHFVALRQKAGGLRGGA
eukprot:9503053-Pyramimonas_sp.AAC.1